MLSLYLNNFRCFAGEQTIPVRRLTLLIGENSTGKTSFLAAARIAEKLWTTPDHPDFNEEPFKLGAFDELANYRGGRAGRSESFGIGATHPSTRGKHGIDTRTQKATFTNTNGRPTFNCVEYSSENYSVVFTRSDNNRVAAVINVQSPKLNIQVKKTINFTNDYYSFRYAIMEILRDPELRTKVESHLDQINDLLLFSHYSEPYATAPIRTQPERTYEALTDAARPQGEHVPMILSQIYGHKEWESLREPLEKFAQASGLFDQISVKRLGRSEGSPFQIQVKINGPARNLMDVGYGVSQVLPLIVDLLRDTNRELFLVQQPEVHLHPRAQAELGSFFASLVKTRRKQIIVETHSDYLIDRIRTCVREKHIKSTDVLFLYFERQKGTILIHPITLDVSGNFQSVPESFRGFFMEEEKRNLGI